MGFMSLIAKCSLTQVCETETIEVFCAKLDFILDQCRRLDEIIVLGELNAITGASFSWAILMLFLGLSELALSYVLCLMLPVLRIQTALSYRILGDLEG